MFNIKLPTNIFSFSNNNDRTKKLNLTNSNYFGFDNSVIKKTEDSFTLSFCDIQNFNSSKVNVSKPNLVFSQGVVPYLDAIGVISDINSTYEDVYELIENHSVKYYWFDNSVPSKVSNFQTKLIPLGFEDSNIQFSIRMPFYDYSFEYNVEGINTISNWDMEYFVHPFTEDDEAYNFEYFPDFDNIILNWEWSPGKALITSTNFEYERIPGTVYPLNFEHIIGFDSNNIVNLEYSNVIDVDEAYNLELQIEEISYFGKFDFEFYFGLEDIQGLNFETESEYSGSINWQTLTFAPFNTTLGFEYVPSRIGEISLNIEYKNVYHDEYGINFESYTEINKDFVLNTEYYVSTVNRILDFEYQNVYHDEYNISFESDTLINKTYNINFEASVSTIWKDYSYTFEYKNVYNDKYNLSFETSIPTLDKEYNTNFEILTFTNFDSNLDFEFLRPVDLKQNIQTYVVPIAYKDAFIQLYIIPSAEPDLHFEFNVEDISTEDSLSFESSVVINADFNTNIEYSIPTLWKDYSYTFEYSIPTLWKDYGIDFEYQHVYVEDKILAFESYTEINKNFSIDFESYTEINKNFGLALEYLIELPFDIGINFESKTVINTEDILNIEFLIESLNKEYLLNLESYVEINSDKMFNLELFVSTVHKSFDIEFDVLDLVYYVISKGYNILPWNYSDGLGFWDTSVNKNWNKTEDVTTFKDGLLNQLQDKSLPIPELIQYSDQQLDNFGLFIPGTSNETLSIQDKILYYESENDYTLVLGKKKKEPIEIIELKQGNNLIIWDGVYNATNPPMFNTEIKTHIQDEFNHCMVWRQDLGIWTTLIIEDHPLYYTIEIEEQFQPIPFILVINVTEDCSFEIKR